MIVLSILTSFIIIKSKEGGNDFEMGRGILLTPSTGTSGQPLRKPQKNELEVGTLIHSIKQNLPSIATSKLSAEFSLPAPAFLSSVDLERLSIQSYTSGQSVEKIGGSGSGNDGISFFGIRSKGEKIALLVDTSNSMFEPAKGGGQGYTRVVSELIRLIESLPKTATFNVILFSDDVFIFGTQGLLPTNAKTKKDAAEWLKPLQEISSHSNPYDQSFTEPIPAVYQTHRYYPSDRKVPISGGTRTDLALLAAYEQGADTIFIISDGVPEVTGWNNKDILKKNEAWQKEFYLRAAQKLPSIHVISYEADPNGNTFLRNLAHHHQGEFRYIKGFHNPKGNPRQPQHFITQNQLHEPLDLKESKPNIQPSSNVTLSLSLDQADFEGFTHYNTQFVVDGKQSTFTILQPNFSKEHLDTKVNIESK